MDRPITLHDYNRKPVDFVVKDLENVKLVQLLVLSGDMVLYILYKDNHVVKFDSSVSRDTSYFDGMTRVPASRLRLLSTYTDPYDALKFFQNYQGDEGDIHDEDDEEPTVWRVNCPASFL